MARRPTRTAARRRAVVYSYLQNGGGVTLGPLSLSGYLEVGKSFTRSILGAAAGSTIAATIGGVLIDSAARTIAGTPTTAGNFVFMETLGALSRTTTIPVYAALGPTAASFLTSAASGTDIATFTGLAAGETVVSVSPNDGRVAIAGAGTKCSVGLTTSSAGTISYTFTTSLGRTVAVAITAAASGSLIANPVPPPTTLSFNPASPNYALTSAGGTVYGVSWNVVAGQLYQLIVAATANGDPDGFIQFQGSATGGSLYYTDASGNNAVLGNYGFTATNKVRLYIEPDGVTVNISVDGVKQVAGGGLRDFAIPSAIQGRTYGRLIRIGGSNTTVTGEIGQDATPLTVVPNSSVMTSDRHIRISIKYKHLANAPVPSGYNFQIEQQDGTVISSYMAMTLVSNTVAGEAVLQSTQTVATGLNGQTLRDRIQQANATTVVGTDTVFIPAPMQYSIGMSDGVSQSPKFANLLMGNDGNGWSGAVDANYWITNVTSGTTSREAFMCVPAGTKTLEVTWSGGCANAVPSFSVTQHPSMSFTTPTQVGPKTWRTTVSGYDYATGWQYDARLAKLTLSNLTPGETPGYVDVREVGMDKSLIWHPDYIARMAATYTGFGRDMDWVNTNNISLKDWTWAERNGRFSYKQFSVSTGVAVENLIEFWNLTGLSAWHVFSFRHVDDYVTKFTQALATGANTSNNVALRSDLMLLPEAPGNETWNFSFRAFDQLCAIAVSKYGDTSNDTSHQWELANASEYNRIMRIVEANFPNNRLIRTTGAQAASGGGHITNRVNAGMTGWDAACAAFYFNLTPAEEAQHGGAIRPEDVRDSMIASIDSVAHGYLAQFRNVVRSYGKRYVSYEGGLDYTHGGGSTGFLFALRGSAEYYLAIRYLYTILANEYGDVETWFNEFNYQWGLELYWGENSVGRTAMLDVMNNTNTFVVTTSYGPRSRAAVGRPYNYRPGFANAGGNPTFAGSLVAGMTFNSTTGAISGSPTATGTCTGNITIPAPPGQTAVVIPVSITVTPQFTLSMTTALGAVINDDQGNATANRNLDVTVTIDRQGIVGDLPFVVRVVSGGTAVGDGNYGGENPPTYGKAGMLAYQGGVAGLGTIPAGQNSSTIRTSINTAAAAAGRYAKLEVQLLDFKGYGVQANSATGAGSGSGYALIGDYRLANAVLNGANGSYPLTSVPNSVSGGAALIKTGSSSTDGVAYSATGLAGGPAAGQLYNDDYLATAISITAERTYVIRYRTHTDTIPGDGEALIVDSLFVMLMHDGLDLLKSGSGAFAHNAFTWAQGTVYTITVRISGTAFSVRINGTEVGSGVVPSGSAPGTATGASLGTYGGGTPATGKFGNFKVANKYVTDSEAAALETAINAGS